jgi:Leucine-rich repeat (LRR) protein
MHLLTWLLHLAECKELYLGNKGIDKIRGFEEFVNLESLCLNGNNLQKINNLDVNFRIKVLNAQDNKICTLKGSLLKFTFLEQLDLSNNQLRDLAKLLPTLSQFQFLTHLNLKVRAEREPASQGARTPQADGG